MTRAEYEYIYNKLKDIILNKPIENSVRPNADEHMQNIEEAMVYLSKSIQEVNRVAKEIASGELNISFPKEHNLLLGDLKELHSVLKHITWQATQVANGDYSQKVANLGEFSDSFNIMISQLKERESNLTQIAYVDALSDVYNRRYCMEILDIFQKKNQMFSLVMIDLNGLKHVNDTMGHACGDIYICTVVSVLKSVIRGDDIICRLGGDEFVLLLRNCSLENAEKKLEEVNVRLDHLSMDSFYSISYGIIPVSMDANWEITSLLHDADEKMYLHKQKMKA